MPVRIVRLTLPFLRAFCCLLLLLAVTHRGHAAEPEAAAEAKLLATMAELTDEDAAKRKTAIAALAQSRDGRLVAFLTDFTQGSVISIDGILAVGPETHDVNGVKVVDLLHPLTRVPLKKDAKTWSLTADEVKNKSFSASRAERKAVNDAITLLRLFDPVREQRLIAVQKAGDSGGEINITALKLLQGSEHDERVRRTISESLAIINLTSTDQIARVAAAKHLGEVASSRALPRLQELIKTLDETKPNDAAMLGTCREAIGTIEHWQGVARGIGHVFSGISLGSVLVLMALGLSIVFGLMGVINMAHGEMLMIGAYAT
ncbi:MAG TPA: hypothetical protein VHX44_10080, partial [Planctomycetota bacterium]|nr:hypothetical protein [Planctomycetota bacterium]